MQNFFVGFKLSLFAYGADAAFAGIQFVHKKEFRSKKSDAFRSFFQSDFCFLNRSDVGVKMEALAVFCLRRFGTEKQKRLFALGDLLHFFLVVQYRSGVGVHDKLGGIRVKDYALAVMDFLYFFGKSEYRGNAIAARQNGYVAGKASFNKRQARQTLF